MFQPLHRKFRGENLNEKQTTLRTKIAALLFGCIFMGLAFLAQFLGGVLQAALTIFGVVGGPLLGLFSLGMFTLMGNEKVAFVVYLRKNATTKTNIFRAL